MFDPAQRGLRGCHGTIRCSLRRDLWGNSALRQGVRSLLMVVVFGGMALAAYLGAQHWQQARQVYQREAGIDGCELAQGVCSQPIASTAVTLRITPAEIPLMQTLRLAVDTGTLDAAGVAVAIRGLNMDMGLNRTVLDRREDGLWHGETILPICSQRRMEWEAAVQMDADVPIELPFLFVTTRP